MTSAPHHCSAAARLDLFSSDLVANPYPYFDSVRESEPVYWDPIAKMWIVTRYDHVLKLLTNSSFEVSNIGDTVAQFAGKLHKDYSAVIRATESLLFFTTGERHKRDRRTLTRVLTRLSLSELRPIIHEFADSVCTRLSQMREFDAVKDYAELFPALIMSRILGLPASDAALFLDFSRESARVLDMVSPSVYDRLNERAAGAIHELSKRISQNVDDADHAGLAIIYEAAPFDGNDKIVAAATLAYTLFIVGTETTSSLIASCINALLEDPQLYRLARSNPRLISRIVSEVTRLESPVQRACRIACDDHVIGNKHIRKGDRLLLFLGAANRDPEAFQRPNELDLARAGVPDLAFGAGKHTCLGMSLARLEAQVALEHVLRLPELVRSGPAQLWTEAKSVRKLSSVPVRFGDKTW